jgi:hypothetical protein
MPNREQAVRGGHSTSTRVKSEVQAGGGLLLIRLATQNSGHCSLLRSERLRIHSIHLRHLSHLRGVRRRPLNPLATQPQVRIAASEARK